MLKKEINWRSIKEQWVQIKKKLQLTKQEKLTFANEKLEQVKEKLSQSKHIWLLNLLNRINPTKANVRRSSSSRRRKRRRRLLRRLKYFAILLIIGTVGYYFYNIAFNLKPSNNWYQTSANTTQLISLPQDDAAHKSKMEWWYFNGHLTSDSGKKYSFHDTTFLINGVVDFTVNHVSFSDYKTGRHYTNQHSSGGNLIGTQPNSFNFVAKDNLMSGSNGVDKLQVTTPDFSFDLQLVSSQPVIFHGQDGIISLSAAGNSYYYSRPRMNISGTVDINGIRENVHGLAWFDHQWGDFSTGLLAWDWFSIQLDDNSDIMIYQLRDKASSKRIIYTGTYTQNGKTTLLNEKDFNLIATKKWLSKNTTINYPIEWQIKIPSMNIDITTKPILNDCEFDASLSSYNIYWEGAVQVSGSHTGKGFMELSGYGITKPERPPASTTR